MESQKESHVGATTNIADSSTDPLLRVSIPPVFNMGNNLEDCKNDLFLVTKIVHRKIPFEQIQPFIYSIYIYQSFK
jgi:hypothetical protein